MASVNPLRTFAAQKKMFLKTDFSQVSQLLLAYPENFQNEYEELVPFYDLLLTKIPPEITLHLIVNNEATKRKLSYRLKRNNFQIILEKEWNEVWVRDIFGIPVSENRILKQTYSPNYCGYLNSTRDYEKLDWLSKNILNKNLTQKITEFPLVLDGGNFISNGNLTILTEKVVFDNGGDVNRVSSLIQQYSKSRPIIIPKCPGDIVGHSDGYLAFINETTVGLSSYPKQDLFKHDQLWLNEIEEILKENSLSVINFEERPSSFYIPCKCEENRRRKCCTMTANGIYINYLRLNGTIILPEYTLPSLKETLYFNSINEIELSKLGFQVIKLKCDEIANQGGILRCLSFVF